MNKRNYFNISDAGKGAMLFIILQNLFILVLTGAIYAGFKYGQIGSLLITALLEMMFVLTVFIIASTSNVHLTRATLINRKPSIKQGVLAVVLAFVCLYGFSGITNVFYYFLRMVGYVGTEADLAVNTWGGFIIEIICVCMVPAVCEELLFRGLLLNGLRRLGKWPAIILSAIVFMLMHGNPDQTVFQLVLGIVLGLAFYNTGSLWVPMIIHFTNNFYVTILGFITSMSGSGESEAEEVIVGSDLVVLLISAIGIAITASFLIYLICYFIKDNKKQVTSQATKEQELTIEAAASTADVVVVGQSDEIGDAQVVQMEVPDMNVKKSSRVSRFAIVCLSVSVIWLVVDWVLAFIRGMGA